MRIKVALHRELIAKEYRFARLGLERTPWNTLEIAVADPFGNRLQFYEETADYRRRSKPAAG